MFWLPKNVSFFVQLRPPLVVLEIPKEQDGHVQNLRLENGSKQRNVGHHGDYVHFFDTIHGLFAYS